MATPPCRWTAEEDQVVLTSNEPSDALASQLGRTLSAVYTRRARLKRRQQQVKPLRSSRTAARIAKEANYRQKGRSNLARHRGPWEEWEADLILAANRPTDLELSQVLGRTLQAIQNKRLRLTQLNRGATTR